MNGNTAGDPGGQYTFTSEQENNVKDYAIVSLDFMSKASLFLEIGCRSESSHMPLHLSILYNPDYCNTKCKKSKKEHRTVFKWDLDKAYLFSEAVSSNIFKGKLIEASYLLNESVESAIKLFIDNLFQAAEVMKRTFWFDNSKDSATNQWFDRECKKPVMPYLIDLRQLMTIKANTFMFKKDHSRNLLLQKRKININVRFIKKSSATNKIVENLGTQ